MNQLNIIKHFFYKKYLYNLERIGRVAIKEKLKKMLRNV